MSVLTKWSPFRTPTEFTDRGPLARWNPMREMERMHQEMDRLFNELLPAFPRGEEAMSVAEWFPCVDITEDEKEFVIKAELPELKKEEIKVTVEEDVLSISGERKAEKEEKGKKFHRIERSYGSFERRFTLPEAADATKISSDFKDGVLTVHLPKNPSAKPRAMEIKVQ